MLMKTAVDIRFPVKIGFLVARGTLMAAIIRRRREQLVPRSYSVLLGNWVGYPLAKLSAYHIVLKKYPDGETSGLGSISYDYAGLGNSFNPFPVH